MVRSFVICCLLLTGCASTPTKVEVVTVNVPVAVPVPKSILDMEQIPRPILPMDSAEFTGDYRQAASDISESFFMLKNYSKLLEEQNKVYRSYILSLPESTK